MKYLFVVLFILLITGCSSVETAQCKAHTKEAMHTPHQNNVKKYLNKNTKF